MCLLLRGQEILKQVVERSKLLGQDLGLHKALRHEHVLHDQLSVWHNNSNRSEERLQHSKQAILSANVDRDLSLMAVQMTGLM